MQKKQTILVVASLLVVVLSVTLAYFTAQIIGEGKNISVSSADLKIVFTDTDGNIEGNDITPGWSNSKTFTVKNESNGTYKYDIIIKDLVNTFKTYKYLQYKITSTDGGYNMTDYSYLPKASTKEDVALAYEVSIDKGKTHTYTIEIKYANDESVDQSIDMGKSLSGTIYIREFTKPTMKLTDKLMADNPTIGTRTTFTAFTETNTKRLYKATEQIGTNPVKDVYYFAGDAKNNWVKFGKTTESSCTYKGQEVIYVNMTNRTTKVPDNETECTSTNICDAGDKGGYAVGLTESECSGIKGTKWITEKATWNGTSTKDIYWRIIRTNHDGSIKLLYAGTSPDTTSGYIGESSFNTTDTDQMYVGYKYGTTDSLENNRLNTNDSTIKTYIDNWYNNNLSSYSKYISTEAIYCNDRELVPESTYKTDGTTFNYASYGRLNTNKTPTYNCTNIKDAFSGSNSEAKLTYPIGLMTADEIAYAGGKAITSLPSPYAWYYLNSAGGSITGSTIWCSLSPSYWLGSLSGVWVVYGFGLPGYLNGNSVADTYAVRPAISLKSCIKYSTGNGTANNPYTIEEISSGC